MLGRPLTEQEEDELQVIAQHYRRLLGAIK
jgi:hypothetical protein